MMTPQQKYLHDAHYRMLTDAIEAALHRAQFTPSEVRECATLAAIHFEERSAFNTRIMIPDKIKAAMKVLEDWRISNGIGEFMRKAESGEQI